MKQLFTAVNYNIATDKDYTKGCLEKQVSPHRTKLIYFDRKMYEEETEFERLLQDVTQNV